MNGKGSTSGRHWFRDRSTLLPLGFVAVAAFIVLMEHRAHVVPWLPWLLVLACPLMHVFMHGSHDHGGHGEEESGGGSRRREPESPGRS